MPSTSVSTTAKKRLFPLLFLTICLLLQACGSVAPTEPATEEPVFPVLAMSEDTAKAEATVKTFVDGDTVHFCVTGDSCPESVMKIRFLAIDTPESTGKIEAYGKKASRYTKDVLSNAASIVIESDSDQWNLDATGSRYLAWVWYRTSEEESYRNLNVELLEQGLAQSTGTTGIHYGDFCAAALEQAKAQKRNLYSGQPDPELSDEIKVLSLQDLCQDPAAYEGQQVQVTATVIGNSGSNGVYIESVDQETGIAYGFYVYYGFNLPSPALDALSYGNLSQIVGTVQFYEGSGSWQLSGLSYNWTDPDAPENPKILERGQSPAYMPIEANALGSQNLYTSVQLQGLTVLEAEIRDSRLILTCQAEERSISLYSPISKDADGSPIALEALPGKTVDAKGIVIEAEDPIQIRLIQADNLTIY